jgi:hypothetical protein
MLGLNFSDIIFAALAAFIITGTIKSFMTIWKVFKNPDTIEINQSEKELSNILRKCYNLFPKEIVQFRGKTFKRGMKVRIVTNQHKTIEGKLIGMNSDNILCVITQKYIVAHEMSNIVEITDIE